MRLSPNYPPLYWLAACNKKSMRRAVCAFVSFLAASTLFVWGEPASPLQRALALSGAYDLLSQISAGLKQGLQLEMPGYDFPARVSTTQAFAEFSNQPKLRRGLEFMVAARVTPDELSEVIQWLDSPLAQKIRKHETQVATVEGMAAMQKFATTSQVDAAPANRAKLCQAIEDEFQLASNVADISLSILAGLERTMAEKSGATPAQVAEIASQLPIPDKEPMRKDTIALCLFTYRNLSDEEIQQYIAHLRSPSGRKFMQAVWIGMRGAFMRAAMDAGERIYESVRKAKLNSQ